MSNVALLLMLFCLVLFGVVGLAVAGFMLKVLFLLMFLFFLNGIARLDIVQVAGALMCLFRKMVCYGTSKPLRFSIRDCWLQVF